MAVCEKCGRAHVGRCQFDIGYIDGQLTGDLVGKQVGSYEIVEEIARGGMGLIYKARHRMIGALAAVKVLRPELITDQAVVDRFVDEARAQARVRHPNTVQVYDLTKVPDGRPCIVMELVEGETLEERLARGPLTPAQALPILVQICNGVAAAHAEGIIHRDIKAENVLLMHRYGRTDFVKVLDFSIAKDDRTRRKEAGITSPGTVLGTPYYMAPEQALGKPVDGRVDVYAVGILAYRCLTSSFPFEGETAQEVMIRQVRDTPPELDWLPTGLRAALRKTLAKNPDERFATMADLAQALRGCAAEIAAAGAGASAGAKPAPAAIPFPNPSPVPSAAPAVAPPSPPPAPPAPPVRVEVTEGRVRALFSSPEAFAKAEREEIDNNRLYLPYSQPVPERPVELIVVVPGRADQRFEGEVSLNVSPEQAGSWGMEPGFALALRPRKSAPKSAAAPASAPAPAPAAPPPAAPAADAHPAASAHEELIIELTEEIVEEPGPGLFPAFQPAAAPFAPAAPFALEAPVGPVAPVALAEAPKLSPPPPTPAPASSAEVPAAATGTDEERYPSAPGGPASTEEIRQFVAIYEIRAEEGDRYGFLGLPPESELGEIHAACRRIGSELMRLRASADDEYRGRIDTLLDHIAEGRRLLCDPMARASYDAGRGNFQGVARAVSAGLSAAALQQLHERFVGANRERAERAAAMLPAIERSLTGRDRIRALELLHQALALDPLAPELQTRYLALRRPAAIAAPREPASP